MPRGAEALQSDGEMGSDSDEDKKFMRKELATAQLWDAKGVSVDQRTLDGRQDGRRASRGFTIAIGKSAGEWAPIAEQAAAAAAAGDAPVRREKRAQTLPAMGSRRADFTLSEASIKELEERTKTLQARYKRGDSGGSVGVAFTVVPDEEFTKCWEAETTCFLYGKITEGQQPADERERVWFGADKFPGAIPPVVSCTKGSKGFRDTTPNQDNFSLCYYKNGYTLACCMDGHGPFGHLVSTRGVQTVPYYLTKSEHFPKDLGAALIEAFEKAHKEIVALSLQQSWDVQASGSTAVAAIWKGNKIWTANVGDSRCVIGSESTRKLLFETEDHKPNSASEQQRIESAGGEVRSQTYPDGWTVHRVFVKGQDFPGLCMTRTLGDESVKAHGVIPTPEIKEYEVDVSTQPFMILASDGVWEFMESDFVVKAVAKKIQSDGTERTVQKLQREARKRWKQEEGDYCDDITAILVQLR